MPYQGRTTEIGAMPRSQASPFTAIENGQAGFVLDGAMAGTTPGNTIGGKIPYLSASIFGIDVPPLAFELPLKIVGNAPPSSTLPTTLPTSPQHYAGRPEGAQDLQLDVYGQSLPEDHPSKQNGGLYKGGAIDTGYSAPTSQIKNVVGPAGFSPMKDMTQPPLDGFATRPAQVERAAEMARKTQEAFDQEEQKKRLWLYAGIGAVVLWLWWRP